MLPRRAFDLLIFSLLLQSAGALQDDEATAKIVYQMLLDANAILTAGKVSEKVRRFRPR